MPGLTGDEKKGASTTRRAEDEPSGAELLPESVSAITQDTCSRARAVILLHTAQNIDDACVIS